MDAGGTASRHGDGRRNGALRATNAGHNSTAPAHDNTSRTTDPVRRSAWAIRAHRRRPRNSRAIRPELGFRRETAPLSMLRVSNYTKAAEGIALRAESRLGEILPCNPTMVGEDACAAQFIATFGRRAFRRPLTTAETAEMQQIYAKEKYANDFVYAIRVVIGTMLASPRFYEIEPKGTALGLAPLGQYQLASRLSYFIYRSMPDAQLLDAAEAGKLATAEGVASQVKRMLADPKAHNGVINFFSEWLTLDRLDSTIKDSALFPTFSSLRADMATETTEIRRIGLLRRWSIPEPTPEQRKLGERSLGRALRPGRCDRIVPAGAAQSQGAGRHLDTGELPFVDGQLHPELSDASRAFRSPKYSLPDDPLHPLPASLRSRTRCRDRPTGSGTKRRSPTPPVRRATS